jgi:hypothetical protein
MASFGVRAGAVVRIPCEDVDLMATLILTASLVRRCAAVNVIQFGVRQNAWFGFVFHLYFLSLLWCGRGWPHPDAPAKAPWRIWLRSSFAFLKLTVSNCPEAFSLAADVR